MKYLFFSLLYTNVVFAECYTNILKTTPTERFEIFSNGTALDKKTGLVWMRCRLGQEWDGSNCIGSLTTYTLQEAYQGARENNFANSNDWRLPNIKELSSIVEQSCVLPSVNEDIFPVSEDIAIYRGGYFWSSSFMDDYEEYVWIVNFSMGSVYITARNDKSSYVRLVRDM